jgi:hypothetical protein
MNGGTFPYLAQSFHNTHYLFTTEAFMNRHGA